MKSINEGKTEAKIKAIKALSRYKFMMFGYWGAVWVHLNQMDPEGEEPNPFVSLVQEARRLKGQIERGTAPKIKTERR